MQSEPAGDALRSPHAAAGTVTKLRLGARVTVLQAAVQSPAAAIAAMKGASGTQELWSAAASGEVATVRFVCPRCSLMSFYCCIDDMQAPAETPASCCRRRSPLTVLPPPPPPNSTLAGGYCPGTTCRCPPDTNIAAGSTPTRRCAAPRRTSPTPAAGPGAAVTLGAAAGPAARRWAGRAAAAPGFGSGQGTVGKHQRRSATRPANLGSKLPAAAEQRSRCGRAARHRSRGG